MKIKNYYYCLIDSNNKPDFRYLFTNKKDAEKKQQQIKNSTSGETLFVSKRKRDFFIDGVKKEFIGKGKLVNVKKGCWTNLKTKKLSLLDTIKPEVYFQKIVTETPKTTLAKNIPLETFFQSPSQQQKTRVSLNNNSSEKKFSNSFFPSQLTAKQQISTNTPIDNLPNQKKSINLIIPHNYQSLFKTKLFAINFTILLLFAASSIVYFNNKSSQQVTTALAQKQQNLITSKNTFSVDDKKIAVLGAKDKKNASNQNFNNNIDPIVFNTLKEFEKIRSDQLKEKIDQMVAGTPMEKMTPYIAKKDKKVAAFLVGIAKKESNYGRRVPVLNGKDCFNYWGYRGLRKRMGSGGHTCFDSPEDAINTVGGRIERLVKSGVDTPQEMVLWKCGSDCSATGGQAAANKWISDVNMYFSKMLKLTEEDDERENNSGEKIKNNV
jgi:hypothetical protein